MDDSQLIQSFAQFSLMNHNANYQQNTIDMYQIPVQNSTHSNEISLENNYSNYEGHLSSLPSHMTSNRFHRSHSINKIPESSTYMKDNFLFEKIGEKTCKDDTTIKIYQNPITIDQNDPNQIQPLVLKNHNKDFENLSNSSYSSKSSLVSFSDGGSCSSLDMSFDGSGMPYIKPYRTSAFAKVQHNNGEYSNSQDSDDYKNQEKEKPMEIEDSKGGMKSSFFRLKGEDKGG